MLFAEKYKWFHLTVINWINLRNKKETYIYLFIKKNHLKEKRTDFFLTFLNQLLMKINIYYFIINNIFMDI